jgi:hypothetical protein
MPLEALWKAKRSRMVSGVLDAGFGAPLRGYIARADGRATLAVRNASARVGVGVGVAF